MKFLEQDLETIIFKADNKALNERGLPIQGKKLRQLRIGNYGVADIVAGKRYKNPYGFDYLNIEIYELKKEVIDVNTYLQAIRYARGVQRYLQERYFDLSFSIGITLIGSKLDLHTNMLYLNDLVFSQSDELPLGQLNSINTYTYTYDFNGLFFNHKSGYALVNEGFNL